jgi:cell wall-associated NlpC family hydrolase
VRFQNSIRLALVLGSLALLQACSTTHGALPASSEDSGTRIAALAESQLGAPYRFGGDSPQGFDCSGLVRYVFEQAGITVPRTAQQLQLAAEPVPADHLQPGDLVFFRIASGRVDHVGIYVGDGAFVHAPRSGRPVRSELLGDNYFQRRYAGAGRLWH